MKPARFDPVIHSEPRLRICAFLLPAQEVGFAEVREALGCSDSVLSKHLKTLSEAGYAVTTREENVPRPRTWVSLTKAGREATRRHLAALQELVAAGSRGSAAPP